MQLYIVGTHHKHQLGPCSAFDPRGQSCDALAAYLKRLCHKLGIKTVAEEMCSDARQKWNILQTIPQSVAHDLGISHADCGPTEDQRDALGIRNENLVMMDGQMHEESDATIQQYIRAEYDKREVEWFRRLAKLPHEPVLFVCGAAHSKSFADKTKERGWHTVTITEDWTPCQS